MENEQNVTAETQNTETYTISKKRRIWILVLLVLGFIATIDLAHVYINSNFLEEAKPSFCAINEFVDCDAVAATPESQMFGVPNALWGMLLYIFILMLMYVKKLSQYKFLKFLEVFKNPNAYIASLGIISFVISMWLLFVSLFLIKKLCIVCCITYVINLGIALLAMDYSSKFGWLKIFKTSFMDFVSALKNKAYLIAFIVVMLCTAGVLTYTTKTNVLAPHLNRIKDLQQYFKYNEDHENPYAIKGNVLGDKNGTVKVEVFSDFRCPICPVYNIIIHKVVGELDNVEIIDRQYPLDTECNKYLSQQMHPNACLLAKYAIAAKKQGNYWGLASEFFAKKPVIDFDIWAAALNQGLDLEKLKKDIQAPDVTKELQDDINRGVSIRLRGTPAISINGGEPEMGLLPDFKLKRKLIKAGAKEKAGVNSKTDKNTKKNNDKKDKADDSKK